MSGFDEKLDPNLKLFFKFFVRLSIFSLDSTFFLPQPLTVFFIFGVYNWPLLYSFGLFFSSTFPLSGLRVEEKALGERNDDVGDEWTTTLEGPGRIMEETDALQ